MAINNIGMSPIGSISTTKAPKGSGADMTQQFADFLNGAIEGQNAAQSNVKQLTSQFAAGELADPHNLLIASEKATLGLQLTVQVRNKAIEAYQEIMRTQM